LTEVVNKTGADLDLLKAALDPEEISRVNREDDQLLIIFNTPLQDENRTSTYKTIPVGILILENCVITVSLERVECVEYFKNKKELKIDLSKKTRFTLLLVYQMSIEFLTALRQISHKTEEVEAKLQDSLKNKYLIELLSLEKTIVYFTTALSGNEKVMQKIFRTELLKKYSADDELVEDVIIELQQATEMSKISGRILRSIRDAFSSIINNSLNKVMKTLASVTIVLTVPVLITSFFGMNVAFHSILQNEIFVYVLTILMLIITTIIFYVMRRRNLF